MNKSGLEKNYHAIQHHKDRNEEKRIVKDRKESKQKKRSSATLVIPNRTTYMKVGNPRDRMESSEIPKDVKFFSVFSPVQLKIVVYLMKEIQEFIKPQLEDLKSYKENRTVENRKKLIAKHKNRIEQVGDSYFCDIPKKLFVSGRNYGRLEKEIQSLAWIPVQLETRHPKTNERVLESTTLFTIYEYLESKKKKKRTVSIRISREVLMLLTRITVAPKGKAQWDVDYFNKVNFDVILRSRKAYTGLLYYYLCPWQNRTGWRVKISKLRRLLGIPETKYKRNIYFLNSVLKPSATELREVGDFWFDANLDGEFVNFKIMNTARLEKVQEKIDLFNSYLKSVHLTHEQIKTLQKIVTHPRNHNRAKNIVTKCFEEYNSQTNTMNHIKKLEKYIYIALRRLEDSL